LTRSEVEQFAETGRVDETIEFTPAAGGRLEYALVAGQDRVRAAIDGGRITIFLPQAAADEWVATDRVGIEGSQSLGDGRHLNILVEKDFACLDRRPGDEDLNAFAHPLSVVVAVDG